MPSSRTDSTEFDTIVLGVGGMGSAACHQLARRGLRVLGLDRFKLVHDRGSSHGESRIIRKAYFEHPDYVPLLNRAYELWHELEDATQRTLLLPTGLLLSGRPDGETIYGARLSANLHGLHLENLTPNQGRQRFPGLEFPADHELAFEPGAGTLRVEDCVQAQVDQARQHGADLRGEEPALHWHSDGSMVHVQTAVQEYRARNLVITTGPWAAECLRELNLALTIARKFVAWFPCQNEMYVASSGFPTYFFEMPEGTFYGFPSFDGRTVKVAEHSGAEFIADPSNVDRDCHPSDLARLQRFMRNQMPGVDPQPDHHSVCIYTLTMDHHFVIDMHPQWPNVSFAVGFSGHGFKFCPVVGEILADFVQHGGTRHPIQFLRWNRGG